MEVNDAGAARESLAPWGGDCHFAGTVCRGVQTAGRDISLGGRPGKVTGLALLCFGWTRGVPGAIPWLSNFLWLAGLVLLARGHWAGRSRARQSASFSPAGFCSLPSRNR